MNAQLDILRHNHAALARAHRVAADTAAHDPCFTEAERRRRVEHYTREAERLERIAEQDTER